MPSLSGEIYRVDPSGRLVDLSHSPYQDLGPVVSPSGQRVAFFSDRSGEEGVYEVGIHGRGIVRVGRSVRLGPEGVGFCCTDLAWQPHGGRLAVGATDGAWIVRPGRASVHVRYSGSVGSVDGWSPNGRVLAVNDGRTGRERMVSPVGRTVWTVGRVEFPGGTWSARGLLAVQREPVAGARAPIDIYDEAGHRRFRIRFGGEAQWSPNGSRIAFVSSGYRLQVRTATGRILLRKGPPVYSWYAWAGNNRVVLGGQGSCGCHVEAVDIRTGKTSLVSDSFNGALSAGGGLAALTVPSGDAWEIQVVRTAGGSARTYAQVPGCDQGGNWRADAAFFQFVPGGRSLVYGSWCENPTADLYSVSAGGGPAHQITNPRQDHTEPALSPDGEKIAYSWSQCTGRGCYDHSYRGPVQPPEPPSGIRVVNTDGSGERVLTDPVSCVFDATPTWSPDASTILFSESTCSKAAELYTVPAAGGPTHDLGVVGSNPAWGPSRIAYVGDDKSDPGLWTANPNGSNRVKVAAAGSAPAWSSDGCLAYLTGSHGTNLVVGSKHTKLPFAIVSSLAWSPDGTRLVIAASMKKTAPLDVYTIKTNGTDPIRLTKNYGTASASW